MMADLTLDTDNTWSTDTSSPHTCHSTTPLWEQTFRDKWEGGNASFAGLAISSNAMNEIVQDIQSLLDHQQAEAVALGEGLKKDGFDFDPNVSGMTNFRRGMVKGNNQAITTYQKALKLSTKK